jgi:hypothetical protein
MYLTENWPSGDAIQIKHRQLQMSQEERERRERQETEEVEAHEGQLEAIRERFRVAFGDQRPEASAADMQEALVEAGADEVTINLPDDDYQPVPTPDVVQAAGVAPEPAGENEFVLCNICEGDWNQCDCCGDCESTEEDCTCWQCGECGEHHDDCVCCGECDQHDCQCPEREAVLAEPDHSADEQKQREIEQLRQRVSNVLGD